MSKGNFATLDLLLKVKASSSNIFSSKYFSIKKLFISINLFIFSFLESTYIPFERISVVEAVSIGTTKYHQVPSGRDLVEENAVS